LKSFFEHLGLSEWPFTVVPRPEFCTYIAGRPQLRDDIAFLLQSLSRRDTSSIHVFWSWLGAGKTHALYYFANEAKRASDEAAPVLLHPVYTEFPKGASSFVDPYRVLVPRLGVGRLVDAFMEVSTSSAGDYYEELQSTCPDLAACMRVLAIETDAQKRSVATRWLRADKLPLSDFRRVGISERLDSTEKATQVLSIVIRLMTDAARLRGRQGLRVVWLLDEFQRLERTSGRTISDVNAGLHSLFNTCPVGLTQVLSFTGPPQERTLPKCFSPELRDRIGTTKVMVLPPCQPGEALTFVKDVVGHFRLPGVRESTPFFPFSEPTCRHIIEYLGARADLRPRAIMHIFHAVLEAADPRIQSGELELITPAFANSVLKEYVVLTDDEEEES
jgi:hypothetical protein